MKKSKFGYELVEGGLKISLSEAKRGIFGRIKDSAIPYSDWWSTEGMNSISALSRLEACRENDPTSVRMTEDGSCIFMTHQVVTKLTDSQAASIGLPRPITYALRLSLVGSLVDPKSKISITWHDRAGRRRQLIETGSILNDGEYDYRLPESLFNVISCVDAVNEWDGEDIDYRITQISKLKLTLSELVGFELDLDFQLSELNLMHASSVSLDMKIDESGIVFDPVLFANSSRMSVAEGELIPEESQLIAPNYQEQFKRKFRDAADCKATYILDRKQYVFIDPSLRPALSVIKNAQSMGPEARAAFAKSPQSFIKQRLLEEGIDDEIADQIVQTSFVETDKFSERVLEIGLWTPPVLPFIKRETNSWVPEGFGIKIGTESILIPEHRVKAFAEEIAAALKAGLPSISVPESGNPIPVSIEVLNALNQLLSRWLNLEPVTVDSDEASVDDEVEDDRSVEMGFELPLSPEKSVLKVKENFEEAAFVAKFQARAEYGGFENPPRLCSNPKDHQVHGIAWLQRCWSLGYPGVLLADDMGLGKTFQTLAFISWLFDKRKVLGSPKRPVMVVAPTTLLGNWQREARLHISPEKLGEMVLLYGDEIRHMRLSHHRSNDVVSGCQTLNVEKILSASWVLTTYETMRDYHISLASINFSCIVFDEIQKIKNPKSMMTHTAQALGSDFLIGLTGTPIENSLADLWTIFDTLMPGALGWGDLKQFMNTYTVDNPENLINLKRLLQEEHDNRPQPMLRRMKSDVAKDLPKKHEHVLDCVMSDTQATEYSAAIEVLKSSGTRQNKQSAFQRIRNVSLHPFYPGEDSAAEGNDYVLQSARLKSTMDLLDEIHRQKEKALLFIESIAMHEWLAFYLKIRYKLDKSPERIFGDISSLERAKIVDRFQAAERQGLFDVLLLSPKAAGVGLTLTAATHVIHLSRWWNPAVEDQCTDRAYRIGQARDVHVHIPRALHPLYGDGSFDCILHRLLERKRELSREMLVPMESGSEIDEIIKAVE